MLDLKTNRRCAVRAAASTGTATARMAVPKQGAADSTAVRAPQHRDRCSREAAGAWVVTAGQPAAFIVGRHHLPMAALTVDPRCLRRRDGGDRLQHLFVRLLPPPPGRHLPRGARGRGASDQARSPLISRSAGPGVGFGWDKPARHAAQCWGRAARDDDSEPPHRPRFRMIPDSLCPSACTDALSAALRLPGQSGSEEDGVGGR